MRRTAAISFHSGILAGFFAATFALGVIAGQPAFSEETASPVSASTGGGTDSSAGAAGSGSSTAAVGGGTTSTAQTDDNTNAQTNTGGAAVGIQYDENGAAIAAAATGASAGASSNGTTLEANASANANAGAIAHTEGNLATTNTESQATAYAKSGDTPTAFTQSGSDMFALAIAGLVGSRTATASAGEDSLYDNSETDEYTMTIAYTAGGRYSVAVASNDRATAFSSTFGNGMALTAADVMAAARTAAYAWASAGRLDAAALAGSYASSKAGTPYGVAAAASASRAGAKVRIEINNSSTSASSDPNAVVGRCVVKVKNNKLWRELKWSQRRQVIMCNCPSNASSSKNRWCPKNGKAIFSAELRF